MLVSLYTSRVILNTLGVEDFGIFNVVGGVVSVFAFINIPMSTASQRFLSVEIGKRDFLELRKVFNALRNINFLIAFIILIFAETVGLWLVKNYLVIPSERVDAAIFVYHFSVLASIITVIQVPYNATIIAHERMNVYAYVSILEVILKLMIVYMLTSVSFDKLKLYGMLYLGVVFIVAIIYRTYVFKNFKESKYVLVKDKILYKNLLGYSGWNMFGTMAAVIHIQGINILLNLFFGPVVNASRGIASQVQSVINRFVSNFQMAVNPQIIISHASQEKDYMFSLVLRSSKFSFYLLFTVSLPIILEIDQILFLWLKTVPQYTSIFTTLVLVLILIDSLSTPLVTAIQATGKIKEHQVIVGVLLLLIIPSSYFFLNLGYSPEITLYIAIIVYLIILFFRLYIVWKLLDFPVMNFIFDIFVKNIFIVIFSFSLPIFLRYLLDESIIRLIIIFFVSLIWTSINIYFIGLLKSEKRFFLQSIQKHFKR
jgi:O-antigen/teichoic acid export membrane protein